MRTGSYAVHQGLTAEAAAVIKQAVTLAKRRGHAQVTPLHVANTMLASANGLLRTACLQSHSHPLQCKALELCFNVALNRLPASNTAMLSPTSALYSHCPSISNALVAAFKRAQAHQRRGSLENQQQPLLAVKIELEQLIISILDDPSVSRVMREAGFSSTQVKSNIEQTVSLEICSQKEEHNKTAAKTSGDGPVRSEDVSSVIDSLMNPKRRGTVVVGESEASLEGVVRGVMNKFEKDDVDESFRGVKFFFLTRYAFGSMSKVERENKIEELKRTITNNPVNKGFILYMGDLKWLFEYKNNGGGRGGYYCPEVEYLITEVGKLVGGVTSQRLALHDNSNGRLLRVMGTATFQTYMKCKNGNPSLETLWGLHPLTIPAGSLHLSLITDTDSGLQNQSSNKKTEGNRPGGWLLPEPEEEKPVRTIPSTTLPAWLQQCKHETRPSSNDQNCVQKGEAFTFSCVSPSSSPSGFSLYNQPREKPFWMISETGNDVSKPSEPTLRMYIDIPEHTSTPPSSNPISNPNSTTSSSSDDVIMETEYVSKFRELSSENLKTLCNALEKRVPWQKHVVPAIVTTILQCRSGMLRRKGNIRNNEAKEETWLFFQGSDVEAKEKVARELATQVFGSHGNNNFVSIALCSFSSSSTEEFCRNKRSREEQSYYVERLGDEVSRNPHRVFLVEDIDQADYCSQLGLKRAIERGKIVDSNGKEVSVGDAIIIFSCESSFSSRSRPCSPTVKQKLSSEEKDSNRACMEETSPCVSLDLNISIDDNDCEEDGLQVNLTGLLESVDRRIAFKIQELYVKARVN